MSTMPVYLPWDTISFEVEIEHNFHLGDAWAVFRRRPQEGEANRPFPLTLKALCSGRRTPSPRVGRSPPCRGPDRLRDASAVNAVNEHRRDCERT